MNTYVAVLSFEGNVYTRRMSTNDTTVYMDTELALFDTQAEADAFVQLHYPDYHDNDWLRLHYPDDYA